MIRARQSQEDDVNTLTGNSLGVSVGDTVVWPSGEVTRIDHVINPVRALCPCCRQPVAPSQLLVDLDTNTVACGGHTARVRRKYCEMIWALREGAPGAVSHERLISRVWGLTEPPDARMMLRHYACRVRKVLRPLGFGVLSVPTFGYRLVEL